MNIQTCFKRARDAAMKSDYKGNAHIGCVILYKKNIIAEGWNSSRTHTQQMRYNHYRDFDETRMPNRLHAEVMALNKIKYLDIDFSKIEIFVYRELANKREAIARPCESCSQMIRDMGIKHVYYTTKKGYNYERF